MTNTGTHAYPSFEIVHMWFCVGVPQLRAYAFGFHTAHYKTMCLEGIYQNHSRKIRHEKYSALAFAVEQTYKFIFCLIENYYFGNFFSWKILTV